MAYRTQSPDTHPDAERVQFDIWRRMTSEQKLDIVFSLMAATRRQAELGIRERHPDASDREVQLRLFSTWLDRDTMIRAYGFDPAGAPD